MEEADRLIGLELGADDYITKPFSPRELVARVRAIFRRVRGPDQRSGMVRTAGLEIDLNGHQVKRDGQLIRLTPIEFDLLAAMADRAGQTFTRAQLLARLHSVDYEGLDRSVDSHIKNLRRKIEASASDPRYILTVFGVGYKFNGEVDVEG